MSPGDSIQALVNANPAGTTFLIKAGVHRRQQVMPKNGDSFVGEPGAVLDGGGVTQFAFGAGGVGVTVRGLVVQNYAPKLQEGVIRLGGGAHNWLVKGNEVRFNRGVGIAAGPGWVVRNNYVHHQGQLGVGGSGDDITFEGNEIAFNNTDDVDPYWEAGGSKFVHTRHLVLRNNYVHDNKGPGLWLDGNNIYALYEGNRIINNYGPGIFHETSYDAVIRYNLIEGNGFGYTGWVDGAGILVNTSPNVEVYGNTVRHNNDGIAGIQANRGAGNYGPYQLRNLWVHDNIIAMDVGQTGVVRVGGLTDPVWSPEWNNRFDYNTYTLGTADKYYAWDPWYMTTTQWRAAGQDPHSTWTTSPTTVPGAPTLRRGQPGDGWVTVSWVASTTAGAAIRDYLVEYRPKGTARWVRFPDGVSTALTARVTGLTNTVVYEFQVAAENGVGAGPWSPRITMRVGVPARPGDLAGTAGDHQVLLAWDAPTATGGAAITDYVIRYRPRGAAAWIRFHDGVSAALHGQVTGLENGVVYEFQVAARNSRGPGLWSRVLQSTPRA